LTTPAPAPTPRAFPQRSLAALGRLAWLKVLVSDLSRSPRDVLLPPVPSRARRFTSSSCSTGRIEVVRPPGHGPRIHRDTLAQQARLAASVMPLAAFATLILANPAARHPEMGIDQSVVVVST
jgi:hypothetical protein